MIIQYRQWTDAEITKHLAAQEETNRLLAALVGEKAKVLNSNTEVEVQEPALLNSNTPISKVNPEPQRHKGRK